MATKLVEEADAVGALLNVEVLEVVDAVTEARVHGFKLAEVLAQGVGRENVRVLGKDAFLFLVEVGRRVDDGRLKSA